MIQRLVCRDSDEISAVQVMKAVGQLSMKCVASKKDHSGSANSVVLVRYCGILQRFEIIFK